MNKQDIIYKELRNRIQQEFNWDYRTEILDEITDYIVAVTKLEIIVEALRYISGSRNWDGIRDKHLLENLFHIQDKAEDALMELYKHE